jgi:tripartite-type tricarboxylate transporter receptor subunit TctC
VLTSAHRLASIFAIAATLVSPPVATAQRRAQPIRIVVPTVAGGASDVFACHLRECAEGDVTHP